MKEELTNEKLREAEDKEIDIQELLFKYADSLALVCRGGDSMFDFCLYLLIRCYSCI